METGSSSVLSAGSSSFSPSSQVRKNSSSFSCCSVTIFMDSVKKVFYLLNTLQTASKQYVVGGVPSLYMSSPPLWPLGLEWF